MRVSLSQQVGLAKLQHMPHSLQCNAKLRGMQQHLRNVSPVLLEVHQRRKLFITRIIRLWKHIHQVLVQLQ
jgi:hypothetical protein